MTQYGAIPTATSTTTTAAVVDNSFEEYDVDYVPQRKLSTKERISKIVTAGVPILVAVLLMLGFGWWTTKALSPRVHTTGLDHTTLPVEMFTSVPISTQEPLFSSSTTSTTDSTPPKHSSTDTSMTSESGTNENSHSQSTSSTTTSIKSTRAKNTSISTKACLDNPECKALGLVGDCCPTTEGVRLGCCS